MVREGQVVLIRFPQTDEPSGKLRPALVLRNLPGPHKDWLICMISSRLSQQIREFDEIVDEDAPDFARLGRKQPSVVRISRLAITQKSVLLGAIGEIDASRLARIKKRLADWIAGP